MEKSKKNKKIKVILVIAFIILFVLYSYISYRAGYLQTSEIGEEYLKVFEQNNIYKGKIFIFNFIVIFSILYICNRFIKKEIKVFFDDEKKQMPKLPNKSIAFVLSTIISSIVTTISLEKFILFTNTAWFGKSDPIFGLDVGFYLFQKPFIAAVLYYIVAIIVILTIYMAAYYIAVFNIYLQGIDKELLIKSKFIKRLKRNALLIVIGIAGIVFLNTYNIVLGEFISLKDSLSTKLIGAGLSDITIKLWGYRLLTIVMIVSTIFILKYINKQKLKKMLISISIVPVYLVGLFIILLLFNLIFVNTNKLDKEKEYIGYNINFTKSAYNLNINEKEYENSEGITRQDLQENKDVINNIRIVDDVTTLKTLNSLQTNSGYYVYKNTRLQKYKINGQDLLIYVSPREINSSTDSSTYNNKTYEYTHGFGSIMTYSSKVSDTGNVEYLQKNFKSNDDAIYVKEPRIYFGTQTDNTIITNSNSKSEFDYPINSNASAEYTYNGKAGIKANFIDRLILSIMNKNVNVTFSKVNNDSKILLNRNIIKRAEKIMPNLLYDEEPYLIVSDEGKQLWVLDAYTISNEYPYSQRTIIKTGEYKKEINYIRNSVKVLIDAYDGTVDFYITDKTDPIIIAYDHAYPELFKDGSIIPDSISSHFVYSKYLYNVQADVLKYYHNISEDVLYRGDDVWNYVSFSSNSKTSLNTNLEPYYTMVRENNENKIGLVVPYTVYGKQNITSYLIATVEKDGSLNLNLYKYASGSNVLGPVQLDKEIEQDETISKQIQSINVTGTKITKNIIMVPINNSLLYVEPIYQQQLNENNSIPLLKKIVVSSGNKVAIGDNINEALDNLLSQSAVNIKVENTDTIDDIINSLVNANNNLKDSMTAKNFELMGKDITKIQDLIDKLEYEQKTIKKKENNIKTNTKQNAQNNNVTTNVIK